MLCVRGLVSDHLKVLDFGLVKEPAQPDNPNATDAAALLGTPLYMAPEAILNPTSVGAAAVLATSLKQLEGSLAWSARDADAWWSGAARHAPTAVA